MEYYYIINKKCFRGKLPIDEATLNTESKYREWKSNLKRVHVTEDDLSDLEMDITMRKKSQITNTPFDFTDYILQKQNA